MSVKKVFHSKWCSHQSGSEKVEDLSGSDRARFEKMDPKEQKEMLAEAYKFEKPCPEVNVTPEVRQEGYEAFVTTDDHLMHLTGITKDQNGTKYYITKILGVQNAIHLAVI